jgi:ABC-type phosphate transport system substrate-binding protein
MTFLQLSAVATSGRISGDLAQLPPENTVLARTGLVVGLLMAGGATLAQAKDVALIANKGGAVTSVTMPDLVKLCKAQTPHWPDGKAVTLVVRDPSSSDMRMILEKVYAMAPQAVSELFASANHGKGAHPMIVVVTSDDDLVHKVAATPGAIGLVDVYAINSSVDVMKIAGKLPFEPGYPLHGN